MTLATTLSNVLTKHFGHIRLSKYYFLFLKLLLLLIFIGCPQKILSYNLLICKNTPLFKGAYILFIKISI